MSRLVRGARRRGERLAYRLLGQPQFHFPERYVYSQDFVSHWTPLWEATLAEFRGAEDIHFLEIGAFEGRSAVWFLTHILTHPTSTLTCVDLFHDPRRSACFDHNIRLTGAAERVTKLRGPSESLLPALAPRSFHAIYVDGSHKALNVLMDAVAAWRLLKPGGIMLFDDYGWSPEKPPLDRPALAIDLFLEALEPQLEVLSKRYQVIVRKKR